MDVDASSCGYSGGGFNGYVFAPSPRGVTMGCSEILWVVSGCEFPSAWVGRVTAFATP